MTRDDVPLRRADRPRPGGRLGDGRVPALLVVGSEGDGDDALTVELVGTVGDVAATAGLAPGSVPPVRGAAS